MPFDQMQMPKVEQKRKIRLVNSEILKKEVEKAVESANRGLKAIYQEVSGGGDDLVIDLVEFFESTEEPGKIGVLAETIGGYELSFSIILASHKKAD